MIKFLDKNHKLFSIAPVLRAQFEQAQANLLHNEFGNAAALCRAACAAVQVNEGFADGLADQSALSFADQSKAELMAFFDAAADRLALPEEAKIRILPLLVNRVQLLRAFSDPESVISFTTAKIAEVASGFPKSKKDLELGNNPGDVLDPYIMTAARYLMYQGRLDSAMEGVAAHKALMMIEGLVGHLHEDVIGKMRGNVRIPEPRKDDQETLDFLNNPFPGADLAQPPWQEGEKLRLHQVKNKTGSAKGGDGARLGLQFKLLQDTYDAETFYDALVGKTLQGHRSKAGVLRVSPSTVVLVGQSAFKALTGSPNGAELLLSVYQNAFIRVAKETGYDIALAAKEIAEQFVRAAAAHGEDVSSLLLHDTINGPDEHQDSRLYPSGRSRRGGKGKGKGIATGILDDLL